MLHTNRKSIAHTLPTLSLRGRSQATVPLLLVSWLVSPSRFPSLTSPLHPTNPPLTHLHPPSPPPSPPSPSQPFSFSSPLPPLTPFLPSSLQTFSICLLRFILHPFSDDTLPTNGPLSWWNVPNHLCQIIRSMRGCFCEATQFFIIVDWISLKASLLR